jgi:hypothetical protein
MGKGPLIVGALAGLGLAAWATRAAAQPAARSVVTASVKVRRGVRPKWSGVAVPPAELDPRPKYKPGQQVIIRNPEEPGVTPDTAVEGKTVTVKELIYYEPVAYGAGGIVTPLPEKGSWGYLTDLVVSGQPVTVAETSLYSK